MKNELILSPALFLFKIRVDLLDFVEYMDTKKNKIIIIIIMIIIIIIKSK